MLRFRMADMRYSRFPWVLVAMRLQKTQGQLMAALPQPLKPFAVIKDHVKFLFHFFHFILKKITS